MQKFILIANVRETTVMAAGLAETMLFRLISIFITGQMLTALWEIFFVQMKFDNTRWSCQWNTDQNWTQNSAVRW